MPQRRDDIDQQERQQREAVIAEFDAGDTDATLHAMAAAILDSRRAMAWLARRFRGNCCTFHAPRPRNSHQFLYHS